MKLSVVIPVSNDIKINQCLKSINERVEVIIVLNKPSKEVLDIIDKWQNSRNKFYLTILNTKSQGISLARNLGVERAKNEKILFIDADCILDKKCIEIMDKRLSDYDIVKGEFIVGNKPQTRPEDDYFTPNLGIRKNVFYKLGRFDENLSFAEDYDLSLRISKSKFSRMFEPKAIVYHPDLRKIMLSIRRFFKFGKNYYLIDQKNKNHECLKRSLTTWNYTFLFKRGEDMKNKLRSFLAFHSRLIGYIYEALINNLNK
jgi:glycosyltransferase involved in cell wall biosynthesis